MLNAVYVMNSSSTWLTFPLFVPAHRVRPRRSTPPRHKPLVMVDGIWVKLKYLNPSGSIKARIAKYMIERAYRKRHEHGRGRQGIPDAGGDAGRDERRTAGDLAGLRRAGDDARRLPRQRHAGQGRRTRPQARDTSRPAARRGPDLFRQRQPSAHGTRVHQDVRHLGTWRTSFAALRSAAPRALQGPSQM